MNEKISIKSYNVRLVLLVFVCMLFNNIEAQQFSTIHWMQGIPQSIYSNPGLQPDARVYIGMPGASSMYFGMAHTGFRVDDLLRKNDDGSFYFDEDNMLSKLKKNNFLGIDYNHEVLAFGFRSRDNYYSLNITEKADVRFGYPEDLMFLAIKGNDHFAELDRRADFSGIGVNASYYRELGLGFSRQWLTNLTAGLRAKVLFGMGNMNFEKMDVSLYTNPDTYALNTQADILVNTNLPFLDISYDEENNELNFEEKDEFYPEDVLFNMDNLGFAIDIGGVYDIDDRFSVAFSVLDLGFINWESDVSNVSMNGEFDFQGFTFDDLFNDDEDYDLGQHLLDSINEIFVLDETKQSYTTMLPTKILLSGTYNISEKHKAGLSARGEFYDGSFYPTFTAAYSIQPIPAIGAALSYSIIHGNYSNVGAGLHLNIWPLQIYVVTDNFIPALQPHTIQTTTVQFGVNWVIGYRPKDIAQPLYCW